MKAFAICVAALVGLMFTVSHVPACLAEERAAVITLRQQRRSESAAPCITAGGIPSFSGRHYTELSRCDFPPQAVTR